MFSTSERDMFILLFCMGSLCILAKQIVQRLIRSFIQRFYHELVHMHKDLHKFVVDQIPFDLFIK